MAPPTSDIDVMSNHTARAFQEGLRSVSSAAARILNRLREAQESNDGLRQRIRELENELELLRRAIDRKEADITKLRGARMLSQRNDGGTFTKEEAEALKAKVRELLARITTHLEP